MRRARDVALPAVVASRAMAWPKVQQLDAELAKAGLLPAGQLLAEHDAMDRGSQLATIRTVMPGTMHATMSSLSVSGCRSVL